MTTKPPPSDGQVWTRPDRITLPDGRTLLLFGPWKGDPSWPFLENQSVPESVSHARWHPLRQEWVIYAAARQNRTYKPPANICPLCPGAPGGELPLDDFTLAVFENRFPSMRPSNELLPDLSALGLKTHTAKGACEVVVYASAHDGNLATIPSRNRELLVKVWGQRWQELLENPNIHCVMPFENRGEDAGVTLHHPHGQIYSFGDLPPVVESMAKAFEGGYDLQESLKKYESQIVFDLGTSAAFVPPFARFPYEMWITTKRFHPASASLDDTETQDVAELLRRTIRLYDAFFESVCPYVMIVYMAPKGHEKTFPFHIQFMPLLRTPGRLKYLAGCEQGAGRFLVDVLPENAAQALRNVNLGEKS